MAEAEAVPLFGCADPPYDPSRLPRYLLKIRTAARRLAGDADPLTEPVLDSAATIHEIAKLVVQACHPALISADPALCLPEIPIGANEFGLPIPDEPEECQDDLYNICPYQMRRVDYLRDLLRAMFPIVWDVAVATVELLADKPSSTAVILFGQWLYVAPHITPLVSALLKDKTCPLEFTGTESPAERFVIVEACHRLCKFYCKQRLERETTLLGLWDWTGSAFSLLPDDNEMQEDIDWRRWQKTQLRWATSWHAVRVAGYLLNLAPTAFGTYLRKHGVEQAIVPWEMHSWDIHLEEGRVENMALLQRAQLWQQTDHFDTPTAEDVRKSIPLPSCLVDCGQGLVLLKANPLESPSVGIEDSYLIRTVSTRKNLSVLAAILLIQPHPPPVLVCGPAGSGKSTLIREMARILGNPLLEIHVDDETDSKALIGCVTTTEIPGRFEWRAGALTKAVRQGRWVLLEDLDRVPFEIQASLVPLLENRLLPLGDGRVERAHPNFRLFSTHGPQDSVGRKVLASHCWAQIPIDSLSTDEIKEVARCRYDNLPDFILDTLMTIFDQIRGEDRMLALGRLPSVRDFFKVLSRISRTIPIDRDTDYATEGQRILCLGETMDVFAASCPDTERRRLLCNRFVAPAWKVTSELARSYLEKRIPEIVHHVESTELGRVCFPTLGKNDRSTSTEFATTGHALRFMESIAVCVRENEPVLLVGETGGGKTTLVQQLGSLLGRHVVVQNLSLQTDSADLLGGFRPLEMKHVARRVYQNFVDLFTSTFSRKQNMDFLRFAKNALNKQQWKKMSQCFQRASDLGLAKIRERKRAGIESEVESWEQFAITVKRFEQQRLACDSGLAFEFSEGVLVDAIRCGKWVLLDEINLASSEILQRLCGLLDSSDSSIILTERGDSEAITRHPDFRLFAAMNPATDAGKKDLSPSVRSRFTEIYVDEILDPIELRIVVAKYLSSLLSQPGVPAEETEIVRNVVDLYLRCREMSELSFVDGGGHRARYTLRTLSRALVATKSMVVSQKFTLSRALVEGFELAFQGCLDGKSAKELEKLVARSLGEKGLNREHPSRCPGGNQGVDRFVLLKPFWIPRGPKMLLDMATKGDQGLSQYVMTPTTWTNVRRLARVVASGPWPVLLEGPTSAGKTSVVEYIAARCGYNVVRINNHEHTDIQEYLGAFAPDDNGSLVFQDGLLVRALRNGDWVILDELNLAPSEVLEALNRLLDDNRELFLADTHEVVQAHSDFRIFATQNPSGAYGGRKPLSRAFRNRFVEIHVGDIPSVEMVEILEKKSGCAPSHAKILVAVMDELRQRRSTNNIFAGKDSLITPRDLLRWADRKAASKKELAEEGYMLLAEKLRTASEKKSIQEVIEKHSKISIDVESLYYAPTSMASKIFSSVESSLLDEDARKLLCRIAPTKSFLRLITLVERCYARKEPVLLVGDTGCGKTTVIQLLCAIHKSKLGILNCHATTETSDLLGSLRPIRGRERLEKALLGDVILLQEKAMALLAEDDWPSTSISSDSSLSPRELHNFATMLMKRIDDSGRCRKRQKIDSGGDSPSIWGDMENLFQSITDSYRKLESVFEWCDGQLVKAMKEGRSFLMDEISLADDAVIERINSVLEPSRSLVLAEKTSLGNANDRTVVADPEFQLFATMNPGGDFGKRELSPALRSRFTEIWVTPISESSDVNLVIGRLLASEEVGEPMYSQLRRNMMQYFEWFNATTCLDQANPREELSLSVRDLVSWVRFVSEATQTGNEIAIWDAYFHGACLMHLDGLGLGTVVSESEINSIKDSAMRFLESQIKMTTEQPILTKFNELNFRRDSGKFGAEPFWIPEGPLPRTEVDFDFSAPTTGKNLFRLLRGMQLSKPILMEGPPGVGKTTLAVALAKASGHRLVRINLSEQTDMADLIGGDLPSNESDSRGSFHWIDGVLLSAMKSGDWVLLDELNLASQSVLEGLNSILDHRAAVYIPELAKTVKCPPTFRVFAAQNPLGQGGGRKGLPKSFLNRFTKVYVDPLSHMDMLSIVQSKFAGVSLEECDKLVLFNTKVQTEVSHLAGFGQKGAPWEFNLRDVFRLVSLLDGYSGDELSRLKSAVQDLYLKRFRCWNDREKLADLFSASFGVNIEHLNLPNIQATSDGTFVGSALLPKARYTRNHEESPKFSRSTPFYLRGSMEALSRCIENNWPALLVLNSCPEGCSLVDTLAEMAESNVKDIFLTPASDVSELIGTFQQVGRSDRLRGHLIHFAEVLSQLGFEKPWVSAAYNKLQVILARREAHPATDTLQTLRDVVSELQGLVGSIPPALFQLHTAIEECVGGNGEIGGLFAWRDGVLVDAMLKGDWIHLKNVNLCPASVLDRLNSVLEPNGLLMLSECGTGAGDGGVSRVIRPHPNFRIFLSMDPEYGEISRAMRNRCVEISLIPNEDKQSSLWQFDQMGRIRNCGITSNEVASILMDTQSVVTKHLDDSIVRSLRSIISLGCSRAFGGYLYWHMTGTALKACDGNVLETMHSSGMLPPTPNQSVTGLSKVDESFHAIRALQLFCRNSSGMPSTRKSLPSIIRSLRGLHFSLKHDAQFTFSEIKDWEGEAVVADMLSCSLDEVRVLAEVCALKTVRSITGQSISAYVAEMLRLGCQNLPSTVTSRNVLGRFISGRLTNTSWALSIDRDDFGQLVPLKVSLLLSEGKMEASAVTCKITPMLYPFFLSMNQFLAGVLRAFGDDTVDCWTYVERLMLQLDGMRHLLSTVIYSESRTSPFGFPEDRFTVSWKAVKESLKKLVTRCPQQVVEGACTRDTDTILQQIDNSLFHGGRQGMTEYREHMPQYPVPRLQADWIEWQGLVEVGQVCVISNLIDVGQTQIDLPFLLSRRHAALFVTNEIKSDIVDALSTVQTAYIKGAPLFSNHRNILFDLLQSRLSKLMEQVDVVTSTFQLGPNENNPDQEMSVHELQEAVSTTLRDESTQEDMLDLILGKFAVLQVAPCYEYVYEKLESFAIKSLSRLVVQLEGDSSFGAPESELPKLCSVLKDIIATGTEHLQWSLKEVSAFQVVLWALTSSDRDVSMLRILRSIMTCVRLHSAQRAWRRSSHLYGSLSLFLKMPSPGNSTDEPRSPSFEMYSTNLLSSTLFSFMESSTPLKIGANFRSIENYQWKEKQASMLTRLMAKDERVPEYSEPWDLSYLVDDILCTLYQCHEFQSLNVARQQIRRFGYVDTMASIKLAADIERISMDSPKGLLALLIPKVLSCLRGVWILDDEASREIHVALTQIWVGVLRYHLYLPDAPVDPSRIPAAKANILHTQSSFLHRRLAAIRIKQGLATGEVSSIDEYSSFLAEELSVSSAEALRQEENSMERLDSAPPFLTLFDQVHEVADSIMNPETLNHLSKLLQTDPKNAIQKLENWHSTSKAFFSYVASKFSAYSEIIDPLIESVGIVDSGLELLAETSTAKKTMAEELLTDLFQFPRGARMEFHQKVYSILTRIGDTTNRSLLRGLNLAGVSSLFQIGYRSDTFYDVDMAQLFSSIMNLVIQASPEPPSQQSTYDAATDEAVQEAQFREQFPNIRSEFEVRTGDDSCDVSEGENSLPAEDGASNDFPVLKEDEYTLLCDVHASFFSNDSAQPKSPLLNSFLFQYSAVSELSKSVKPASSSQEGYGCHVFALALACGASVQSRLTNTGMSETGDFDFHLHPYPEQTKKVAEPLKRLAVRVASLLCAFPGNAVLVSVVKVVDKVRKLDVNTSSIGKVMVGLEAVLKHAQDWEQYASQRVSIGEPLKKVSGLVAYFRRLELQSWPGLLHSRERRFRTNAKKRWVNLFRLLKEQTDALSYMNETLSLSSLQYLSPLWLWVGKSKQNCQHARCFTGPSQDLSQFVMALDTFLLTSPLGEFVTRLSIIDSFASETLAKARLAKNEGFLRLSRVLRALYLYYRQFKECIATKIAEERQPFEKRLRDEVKLAKWDEQSYYSLASSSEKSHRKLMMILRGFDEILSVTVASVLEKQMQRGIFAENGFPTDKIPSPALLFLCATSPIEPYQAQVRQSTFEAVSIENVDNARLDEICATIGRYSARMKFILEKDLLRTTLGAYGHEQACTFVTAVFERIESLRNNKASRLMKERSLVDLFKELKHHGYSPLKWKVPAPLRRFGEIILLPQLIGNNDMTTPELPENVTEADSYFYRCIAEMNRLDAESRLPTQHVVTQRQIEQMLSFGAHAMLMTGQQRSTLAYVLVEFERFKMNVKDLCQGSKGLPCNQGGLSLSLASFKSEMQNFIVKIQQTKMLFQEAQNLSLNPSETEGVRNTLEVLASYLKVALEAKLKPHHFVLSHHIACVGELVELTRGLRDRLENLWAEDGSKVIPGSVLSNVSDSASHVIMSGEEIIALSLSGQSPDKEDDLESIANLSTELVDYCRLSAQVCMRGEETPVEDASSLWATHQQSTDELNHIRLERLAQTSLKVLQACQSFHDTTILQCLLSSLGTFCSRLVTLLELRIEAYAAFHRSTAKLHYILFRIFRVLVSRGFCTVDSEEKEGDAEGDVAGMNFEEQDGTGMGEGEGSQDVTDQIEDEEQLLGLKSDEQKDPEEKDAPGKLGKEEADTGMEMENDFEGELYDLPSEEENQMSGDDGEDQEEIDREMGDDGSPNDDIIDKKLWDGANDEKGESEETLDKGGSLDGEVLDDEMITKDDSKEGGEESSDKQEQEQNSKAIEQQENNSDAGDENQEQFAEEETPENIALNARDDRLPEENSGFDNDGVGEDAGDMEVDLDCDPDVEEEGSVEDNELPSDIDAEGGSSPNDLEKETQEEAESKDVSADEDGVDEQDENPVESPTNTAQGVDAPEDSHENNEIVEDEAVEASREEKNSYEGLGMQTSDGKDRVLDESDAAEYTESMGPNETQKETEDVSDPSHTNSTSQGGSSNGEGDHGATADSAGLQADDTTKDEAPNPFKSPGDVEKFWHRKLDIIHSEQTQEDEEAMETGTEEENHDTRGQFEHVTENQTSTTQALGDAKEQDQTEIEQNRNEDHQMDQVDSEVGKNSAKTEPTPRRAAGSKEVLSGDTNHPDSMEIDEVVAEQDIEAYETIEETHDKVPSAQDESRENIVATEVSRLSMSEDSDAKVNSDEIVQIESRVENEMDLVTAQAQWNAINSEVHGLSRRICEKLRLVLEPLVATKLRGDYRTGKRINMKRVIGYIASGFRKDKIWLRRTKPAKRNYRVLVAVDDSESMAKNGAGHVALRALAALSIGMSQLEIGEMGIAKFGDEMQIIHPFHTPFTSESGAKLMAHFHFNQPRTRTALCVESALLSLEEPVDVAPMQLVLLISDGKIERDNKAQLRRLVREMLEKNILMVLVIVDGNTKKDSILTMKEVTFERGKPRVSSFMDDYPFPYYIILQDLSTLPETIGDALRQWFEAIGQLQH